jgi:adenylosuccinate lyase
MSNISPLDSRYKKQVSELNEYFSEQALMGFRLYVEIKYLIFLSKHRALKKLISLNKKDQQKLEKIYSNFDQKEYNAIKKIEAKTKHDVNAVVQYLSKKIEKNISGALVPWVHFGLTSEDINNTAYSLMIKGAVQSSLLKNLKELSGALKKLVSQNKDFPIMALTHGQPATTTSLGKEMAVFHVRLSRQIEQLKKRDLLAKFSGATGTLAAHKIAFPKGSWVSFSKRFIKTLGLKNNPITTQVEPNDSLAELLQNIIRINNILTDMSVDMWLYVERNIFIQKNRASEVGSSTMPHKINPIAFENAEGNLELANSGLEFLSSRLCRSRLQRDLSGSTLFRNVGTSFGHSLLAYKNIVNGLGRIRPNKNQAEAELENNWGVLAEALQTVLRKNGDADAYEKIKKITRGTGLDKEKYLAIVNSLNIAEKDRDALLCLTPSTYLGEIKEILKKY